MKNLTFLLVVLFTTTFTFAQKGVKIGLQFTPGASMALNSEDFDRGADLDLDGAFGFNFGLTVGYGFNETLSLSTGIMFNNHKSAFVHARETFTNSSNADPNYNKKFTRTLGYIRVPLLLGVGGDPADGGGFFFRIGPHFDFLTGGKYKDERLIGYTNYDEEKGLDLTAQTALWTASSDKKTSSKTSPVQMVDIYNKFVVGVTLEMGGQIKLADHLKMIITLHLETSLINPEGDGAASFGNNIAEDVFATNVVSTEFASDFSKAAPYSSLLNPNGEETPFDAMFPNYTNSDQSGATHRDATWNVMGGLTFGFIYTIPVD